MKKFISLLLMLLSGVYLYAQWSDMPDQNKHLVETQFYDYEVEALSDGSFYIYLNKPDNGSINSFLYYFDYNGNMLWENPVRVDSQPSLSYNKVNSHLMIDRDDNAIVVVQDTRKLEYAESYTAYKFDKQGKGLWGEHGVDLFGGRTPTVEGFSAAIQMTQLTDGSFIFAWMESPDQSSSTEIYLQKVTEKGETAFGEGKKIVTGQYPYVIPGKNAEFILFYADGSLYARKMDFDGNDVWATPTTVYSGSLSSSVPLWTMITVVPADGGFLVGWRNSPGAWEHHAQIAYVKEDGTHAFPDGENGLRLEYDERYLTYTPKLYFDKENQCIYASMTAETGDSYSSAILAQKVSLDGELLWGANGKEIVSAYGEEGALAANYNTIETSPKGGALFGYMRLTGISDNSPVAVQASLLDGDGNALWENSTRLLCDAASVKYDLFCLPYSHGQWIFIWEDLRETEFMADGGNLWSQNIHLDGTIGGKGSEAGNLTQKTLNLRMQVYPNPVGERMRVVLESEKNQQANISLLGVGGNLVAPLFDGMLQAGENSLEWQRPATLTPGVYVLKIQTAEGVACQKVVIK